MVFTVQLTLISLLPSMEQMLLVLLCSAVLLNGGDLKAFPPITLFSIAYIPCLDVKYARLSRREFWSVRWLVSLTNCLVCNLSIDPVSVNFDGD